VVALRYGAKSIEIQKGKNAIEVTEMDDLIATLEIIKQAVQAGELDIRQTRKAMDNHMPFG
jgi:hypothetical protein